MSRDAMSARERLRATRARASDLAGTFRVLFYSQGLDFLPRKRGKKMLNVDGFSALTRRLIYLAYALLAVMAFWLIFLLLAGDGRPVQGPPSPAVASVVFIAFSVAWGLLLTGALYTRRSIRLAALFLYLIVTSVWVVSFVGFLPVYSGKPVLSLVSVMLVIVGVALLFTVPGFFFLRRRAQPSPVTDFAVLALLVFVTYATVYLQLVLIPNYVGDQLWINVSGVTLYLLLVLIELLFVILALDIVELLYRTAGAVTVFAGSLLRRRLLGGLVVLMLALQLCLGVWEQIESIDRISIWRGAGVVVVALGFSGVSFVAWWLLQRRWNSASHEPLTVDQMFEVAKKWALLIIAMFWGIGVVGVFFIVAMSLVLPFVSGESLLEAGRAVTGRFSTILSVWFFLTAALAIVVGILAARRGHRAVALYLTILGGSTLLFLAVTVIDLRVGWNVVGSWWAIIFGLAGLYWLWRGRLTTERILRLFLLSLITLGIYGLGKYYVPPTGAGSDAGTVGWTFVVLIALGLLWDLLTIGYWANGSSSGLPQLSRVFLYLGFVILCITSLDWSVMSLGTSEIEAITQIMAPFGLILLGRPLIYATFVITLALPATSEEIEASSAASSADQGPDDGDR